MSDSISKGNINQLLKLVESEVGSSGISSSCGPQGQPGPPGHPQWNVCKQKRAVSTIQLEEVVIIQKSKWEGDSSKGSRANELCPPKKCKCQSTWTREEEKETAPFYQFSKILVDGCAQLQDQTDRCGKPKGRACYARESDVNTLVEGDNTLKDKKNKVDIKTGANCCKAPAGAVPSNGTDGEVYTGGETETKRTGKTKNIQFSTPCY